MAALVGPGRAWAAPCPTWNANFGAAPMTGHESAALTYTWSTAPASCDTFAFHHYEVCWHSAPFISTASAPTTPVGATCRLAVPTAGAATANEFVHRSYRNFAATIFACEDTDCNNYYGYDGRGNTVSNPSDGAVTAKERWVLEDIADANDGSRVISDGGAQAASAVMYGTNYSAPDHLGIWYSTLSGSTTYIKHYEAASAGWDTWNTHYWPTGPDTVAQSATTGGKFQVPTHPWVALVDDGGPPFVRLFVQADDDGAQPYEVYSIDSADDAGTDFDLACTSGTCAPDGGACAVGSLCDWEDDYGDWVPITFGYDNGTTLGSLNTSVGSCTENMSAIVAVYGGSIYEGGFIKTTSGGGCFLYGGVAYIEHRN